MVPITVDKERAVTSRPPPPARKEIVLALRAPSAAPVTSARTRKRKCVTFADGDSSSPEGVRIAPVLRGKFISLIDGMIGDCSTEAARLARELGEAQSQISEFRAMMTSLEDSYSAKASKFEEQIGELERDLGKTASALIKEKKARKAKASEIRQLQRQNDASKELTSRSVEAARSALGAEFQTRMTGFIEILSSLERVYSRDLALASIEGGMTVIRALKGEAPPSLQSEEDDLSARKADLAAVDRSFELLLSDLRSGCALVLSVEDPEGRDLAAGEDGDGAAPNEVGEGEI